MAPAATEPETPAAAEPGAPAAVEPEAPASAEPGAPAAVEPEAPASAEPPAKKAKRCKHLVSDDCIAFYFSYCDIMKRRSGFSQAHCLRTLKEMAPEIYGEIHPATPARWKRPAEKAAQTEKDWEQRAISHGALLRLMEVARKLTDQLSLSASVIRQIFMAELVLLGEPRPLSVSWVKKLLNEMNYSYKGTALGIAPRLSLAEVEDAQGNLRLKIAWLQKHHAIPWDRVWNMDETAVKLLPSNTKGWSEVGKQAKAVGDTHTNITVTVMHGTMPGDLLGQLIFKGKTSRSLPAADHGDSIELTVTENHWCNTESTLRCIGIIDEKINKDTPQLPWIIVLDVCPVHVSKATRALFAERFPWVRTAFVQPGKTCVSQPADVAFMAPLKDILRRTATADLSKLILTQMDEGQPLKAVLSGPFLKNKIVSWVELSLNELRTKERIYEKAWRHLRVGSDDRAAIEAKAEEEHLLKNLFRQSRKDVVPEEAPVVAEIEIDAAILLQPPEEDWAVLEHADEEELLGEGLPVPEAPAAVEAEVPPEAPAAAEAEVPPDSDFFEAEVPLNGPAAVEAEAPAAVGVEVLPEAPAAAEPNVPSEAPAAVETPASKLAQRLRALRIVYGAGPLKK
jgi:hypothetical protein